MKVVIQCAASKDPAAGYFRTSDGTPIKFVANPAACSQDPGYLYARPDDPSDAAGQTWRDQLVGAIAAGAAGLTPAYKLYRHYAYNALAEKYGLENVFILSAGWGLIRADFPTPQYDITFSTAAGPCLRRRQRDRYADFKHLTAAIGGEIVFFGGKDYLPLFCELTADVSATKTVFYNSASPPITPGCHLVRYVTTTRTNWHYGCAIDFINGKVSITRDQPEIVT